MRKIIVNGGRKLTGEVRVGGSKNAALPILFAGILTADLCEFSDLPRVSDVLRALEILRFLGARIRFYESGEVSVDYRDLRPLTPPRTLTSSIRGSTYLLGSMLGRFGVATLSGAGGCDFGARPIDQHLLGFRALGATVTDTGESLTVSAKKGLHAADFTLAMPSVGATANLMLASTAASGETVIRNAAAEPHVAALAAFLTAAGAHISRNEEGTVRVFGITPLSGCAFRMIPDMIEAGTYLAATMACGGEIRLCNVAPTDLGAVIAALADMGAEIGTEARQITLRAPAVYRNIPLETAPFPGFPTDLHPQFAAAFAIGGRAEGEGSVRETIFASRFRYTEGLRRFGARVDATDAVVRVVPALLAPAVVTSPDLRGGAALLIAALAAKGESTILNAATVARGYERLEAKFRALGADITTC